jgi:hypothetical protein
MPLRSASTYSRPGRVGVWTTWPAPRSAEATGSQLEPSNQKPGIMITSEAKRLGHAAIGWRGEWWLLAQSLQPLSPVFAPPLDVFGAG